MKKLEIQLNYYIIWISPRAFVHLIAGTRGPFLEFPEGFSHMESYRKMPNLITTGLFYSHFFFFFFIYMNMSEVSFKQRLLRVCTSLFLDTGLTKMALGSEKFFGPPGHNLGLDSYILL